MIPDEKDRATLDFYVAQLNDLKGRIEKFLGNEITEDNLKKAIEIYNENRQLTKKLYDLRKAENPPTKIPIRHINPLYDLDFLNILSNSIATTEVFLIISPMMSSSRMIAICSLAKPSMISLGVRMPNKPRVITPIVKVNPGPTIFR